MNKLFLLLFLFSNCKYSSEKKDKSLINNDKKINDTLYPKKLVDTICYNAQSIKQQGNIVILNTCQYFFSDSANKSLAIQLSYGNFFKQKNFNDDKLKYYDFQHDTLKVEYYFASTRDDKYSIREIQMVNDSIYISLNYEPSKYDSKLWFHLFSFQILIKYHVKKPFILIKFPRPLALLKMQKTVTAIRMSMTMDANERPKYV